MLSDATFTSPWSSEVLITGDYKLPVVGDSDDDEDIQNLYRSYQYTYEVDNHAYLGSLSGSSCMTTGSDCSVEDLYAEGDDDGFIFDIETNSCIQGIDTNLDLIETPVLKDNFVCNDVSSIDSSSSTPSSPLDNDNLPSPCLDRSPASCIDRSSTSCEDNNTPTSPPNSIPEASYAFTCSTRQSSTKCSTCRLNKTPCKKWSHMSKSEKAKMVDELSLTISGELGLREQMDIIKIINPTASFDKRPSEFVIDLNSIDDIKLERIQNVVNFHCVHSPDINDNHKNSHKKFTKKNKNSDRKPRVAKQRTQKEYRQKLKEKRSGLFVKEQRLAVSTTTMEEEIDIVG